MKCIRPNPMPWHEAFERLTKYVQLHPCTMLSPPKPLIIAGWVYSNDVDKMQRWGKTIAWAAKNGCSNLVSGIPDRDFYFVEKPTSYEIGPLGGPIYRVWDFEVKGRPSSEQIDQFMEALLSCWSEIVGKKLASSTRPLAFTGKKHVVSSFSPPLFLLHHGVAGPIFPRENWSDEPSRIFGEQSTRRLRRMKLTTLTS